MTDLTTTRAAVAARLAAATGPDRDLDLAVYCAATGEAWTWTEPLVPNCEQLWARRVGDTSPVQDGSVALTSVGGDVFDDLRSVPAYTCSLDAALALMAQVLPGWVIDCLNDQVSGSAGALVPFGTHVEITDGGWVIEGQAAGRALAVLAAVVAALRMAEQRLAESSPATRSTTRSAGGLTGEDSGMTRLDFALPGVSGRGQLPPDHPFRAPRPVQSVTEVPSGYAEYTPIRVVSSTSQDPPTLPDDPSETTAALRNCAEAVAFLDQVRASSPDEQAAVGRDHWTWLESACRRAAAVAQTAARVGDQP